MKRSLRVPAIGATLLVMAGCGSGETVTLESFADSASYAVGMSMGASLGPARDQIDLDLLHRGLTDAAEGKAAMTENEARGVLQIFSQQVQGSQIDKRTEEAAMNQREGDAFRSENGGRSEVETTTSGLQYEVLAEGSGARPSATDRVTVHYRGTLIDGTEFDSSLDGDPVTFALNGVIPGWTEALQLMAVGSKYRIVLPPELAYGAVGSPPDIGPDATLVFEVELLSIEG